MLALGPHQQNSALANMPLDFKGRENKGPDIL